MLCYEKSQHSERFKNYVLDSSPNYWIKKGLCVINVYINYGLTILLKIWKIIVGI